MKKRFAHSASLILILFLIVSMPIVSAQTYSGLNRFVDGAKLFFSFGDKNVRVAIDIKEKEINSAIENVQNGNEEQANKNLENAWGKLQMIQEKVSVDTAQEVKENSNEIRNRIIQEGDLTENFDVYVLEEEKTGLTAEWVIEINGKEGQTMNNVVENRTIEIETRIDEIDNEISNWVVEHTYAEGTSAGGEAGVVVEGGLVNVVKTEIANGDNGLKREVKTSVQGDGTLKNDPLPVPNLNQVNPDLYDPNARAPGDTIDDTYDDATLTQGESCGEGVVCGGENNAIDGGTGTEGVHEEPSPAVESNEGDSGITGAMINSENKESSLGKFVKWIFGV